MKIQLSAALLAGLLACPASTFAEEPGKPDLAQVVKGNNAFAFQLYSKLSKAEGNLFFSPYSISTALAMTYAGARGQTAEQMASTLHFPEDTNKLNPQMAALVRLINDPDNAKRGYKLSTANALWGQKGYSFQPAFLQTNQKFYDAGLKQVDFVAETEKARETINAWVEKETNDKIKDLLKKGVLTTDTRLVLTNAIYFKGDWARQFKKNLTREQPFKVSAKETVMAPLMFQSDKFGYGESADLQILEVPYVGKDLSMVVLLPKKIDGLANLEKSLTSESVADWMKLVRERKVMVSLPRFKVTAEFSLRTALSQMGMPVAFTPDADFSGIAESRQSLSISDVVHKAYVDVNEEGTEAAAATGVVVTATSAQILPTFRADHPFIFLIRDKRSGSVLFLGRLNNPS